MYAQRLDLKDDTEVGKGTCAVNIFQLRMVRGYNSLVNSNTKKEKKPSCHFHQVKIGVQVLCNYQEIHVLT